MIRNSVCIKSIATVLLFWLIGLLMGLGYGFEWGQERINRWQVLSAYNSGYTMGHVRGGTQAMYLIFEDYMKENPYHWEMPDQEEQ